MNICFLPDLNFVELWKLDISDNTKKQFGNIFN